MSTSDQIALNASPSPPSALSFAVPHHLRQRRQQLSVPSTLTGASKLIPVISGGRINSFSAVQQVGNNFST